MEKEMTREQLIEEAGRKILRPLGIIQGLFVIAVIASPFIWIWGTWELAWKVGLTGLISTVIIYFIYRTARQSIIDGVDSAIDKWVKEGRLSGKTSKFQERLEQMAKEREQNSKN